MPHLSRNCQRSQRGYDRISYCYRTLEKLVFRNQLQSARVALIDKLPVWHRMLILGDGDGRLLEAILQHRSSFSDASYHVTSVDQSNRMLSLQKQRIEKLNLADRVNWIQTEALAFSPDHRAFDVIAMPFFLDCFDANELDQALPQWLNGLQREGTLYYVDFVLPASGWKRWRAQTLSKAMHVFFRFATGLKNRELIDVPPRLNRLGFREMTTVHHSYDMIITSMYRQINR